MASSCVILFAHIEEEGFESGGFVRRDIHSFGPSFGVKYIMQATNDHVISVTLFYILHPLKPKNLSANRWLEVLVLPL